MAIRRFEVCHEIKDLKCAYPSAVSIRNAAKGGQRCRKTITRMWISEGIPYAFKGCPAIYDEMRCWLGNQLGVSPKAIGLTGSARTGESLSPIKMGARFGRKSDLDLFLICEPFFLRLREEFTLWAQEYSEGNVNPSSGERKFWDDNFDTLKRNSCKDFVDVRKIPNRGQYKVTRRVYNAMWLLTESLARTHDAPSPKKASLRCYRDWDSAINQISLNLKALAKSLNEQPEPNVSF